MPGTFIHADTTGDDSAASRLRYYVSEEQLAQYAALTILERLTWLDQARQFVLLAETRQSAIRRAWLRNERTQ